MPAETHLDVLAIFSHPDDAELTMAGTLLKLKALGYRTGVLDMTRGEMGTRGTPEIRAKESLDGARVMGLDARLNLEQPDGHIMLSEETRQAMVRVLTGITGGLLGAWWLARWLESLLFGVRPHDPATFAAVAVILVLASLAAVLAPGRRAMKIAPATALRWE